MSQKLTQKEYLKKYLSKGDGVKSKKKKKRVKTPADGLKIIDDDVGCSKVQYSDQVELEFMLAEEDAPQVAEIIDETVRNVISYTTENWKTISDEKSSSVSNKQDLSPVRQDNSGRCDLLKSGSDQDNSPPRRDNIVPPSKSDNNKNNSRKESYRSDMDNSPPRRKDRNTGDSNIDYRKNKYNDQSPPRKSRSDDRRDTRDRHEDQNWRKSGYDRSNAEFISNRDYNHYDVNDQSPPRRSGNKDRTYEQFYDKSRFADDSNRKNNYDEEMLKNKRRYEDQSPPRKHKQEYRSRHSHNIADNSPPRKTSEPNNRLQQNEIRPRMRHMDDDQSPPRKSSNNTKFKSKYGTDDDQSPPRKSNRYTDLPQQKENRSTVRCAEDDQSPPRKLTNSSRNISKYNDSDADQSPPRKSSKRTSESGAEKMTKTLDGKTAGLQDAKSLRHETEIIRRKEKDILLKMNDEASGRYAKTVSRKTGRKEDSEDEEVKKFKAAREKEKKEKYSRWGKGLKQVEDQRERMQNDMHEMSKPLARYADDQDLDDHLRSRMHLDDPMLQYMQRKRMEKNVKEGIQVKPQYQGSFPPNRFDIRPGYRWDGVDRSSGYEKSWFEKISSKKASEEEAYKWSTEDM